MGVYSFSAAFKEAKKAGPQFELYGETFELPASLPVGVVLEVQRLETVEAETKAARERGERYEGEEVNVVELFDRAFGGAKWLSPPEDWSQKPGYTTIKGDYRPSALIQSWIDQGLTIDEMVSMLAWVFTAYGEAAPKAGEGPLEQKPTPRVKRGR